MLGYEWFVQEPNEKEFRPKVYAANFYVWFSDLFFGCSWFILTAIPHLAFAKEIEGYQNKIVNFRLLAQGGPVTNKLYVSHVEFAVSF